NFSPLYLSDNFRHIEKELSQKDLKKRLTIEITENFSDATRKEDDLIELSHILSSKGIKVVLDDFGEGGSNISLILKSSFCGLKLSPSLIKEYVKMFNSQSFDYSQKKRVIVSSLIKLVRDLSRYNMAKVYIEGIEKEEDFFRCKQIIDPSYFQGLYFGKPDLITLNL
ncbi:MAG: EAL domain-containing protein, partial [Candidatus Aenigmatarchaeota archaeon]